MASMAMLNNQRVILNTKLMMFHYIHCIRCHLIQMRYWMVLIYTVYGVILYKWGTGYNCTNIHGISPNILCNPLNPFFAPIGGPGWLRSAGSQSCHRWPLQLTAGWKWYCKKWHISNHGRYLMWHLKMGSPKISGFINSMFIIICPK